MTSKTFSANLEELYKMLEFIRQYALGVGLDTKKIAKIELAAEEALVNIINYGYPDRLGSIEIGCHSGEPSVFCLTIKDQGVPFNPLTHAKVLKDNRDIGDEDVTIGGWGTYFMLKSMDEVSYQRQNGFNVLTMKKFAVPVA